MHRNHLEAKALIIHRQSFPHRFLKPSKGSNIPFMSVCLSIFPSLLAFFSSLIFGRYFTTLFLSVCMSFPSFFYFLCLSFCLSFPSLLGFFSIFIFGMSLTTFFCLSVCLSVFSKFIGIFLHFYFWYVALLPFT